MLVDQAELAAAQRVAEPRFIRKPKMGLLVPSGIATFFSSSSYPVGNPPALLRTRVKGKRKKKTEKYGVQ